MATTQDQVKVTRNCRECGQPTHLVQDSTGSMWMHDKLADEMRCGFPQTAALLDTGRADK